MPFRVSLTIRALENINSVAEWYGMQAPDLGRRWHAGIETAVISLGENPERCGLAHETDDFNFDLYELLYGVGRKKTHRILFRITEETVEVLAVRHAAQGDIALDEI